MLTALDFRFSVTRDTLPLASPSFGVRSSASPLLTPLNLKLVKLGLSVILISTDNLLRYKICKINLHIRNKILLP